MQQGHAAYRQPRTFEHPALHRRVGHVLGLDPGGGLDLDQVAGVIVQTQQDVGAHEQVVVTEGRLEQAAPWAGQEPARGRQCRRRLPEVLGHEHPAGEAFAGKLADPVPVVEDGLLRFADGCRQLRPIALQP